MLSRTLNDTVSRMPTRLFLVRHGETEWSLSGQHTSITDLPLTEHGEQQARALHGRSAPQDFQLILSSPRGRARRTAELAGFVGEYEPQVDPDLAEWFYGNYEGQDQRGDLADGSGVDDLGVALCPGENRLPRLASRLDRVIARIRGSGVERAICFGHGHALRALTMRWLGLDLHLGVHFPLDTSTVSVLGEIVRARP